MNQLKPMLLTSLKNYNRSQFVKDVTAGIIVAIIALPLSIALALASGVGPEAGIFTAIVAGFVISALGGSSVQIAGPTAAFATIVAGIVAKNGMDGLIIATILAGVFLILMGLCHFGSLIKFIPYTITTGFTSGIAVTIVIGQLKDFFGISYPDGVKPIETTEKLKAFFENFSTFSLDALIVGGVSLAILILAPYVLKKVPGSLPAVIVGILMVKFLPLKVATIGNLYTISNSLPTLHIPSMNLSMIGDALSHSSLAGVVLGLILGVNPVAGAVVMCIVAALGIEAIRKKIPRYSEVAISIVMSAGIGLAGVLSGFVENGASLNSFLFGSIVSISEGELALVVVISVLVLAAVLFFYRELFYIGFDENAARISGVSVRNINFLFTILTALTVSIASRTVGTLIVSSMLVVPVACGMQMAKSYKGTLICAIIVAVCTTIAGLFLSYYAGLKPGGMIVLLEVAWFVVVMTVKSFNK